MPDMERMFTVAPKQDWLSNQGEQICCFDEKLRREQRPSHAQATLRQDWVDNDEGGKKIKHLQIEVSTTTKSSFTTYTYVIGPMTELVRFSDTHRPNGSPCNIYGAAQDYYKTQRCLYGCYLEFQSPEIRESFREKIAHHAKASVVQALYELHDNELPSFERVGQPDPRYGVPCFAGWGLVAENHRSTFCAPRFLEVCIADLSSETENQGVFHTHAVHVYKDESRNELIAVLPLFPRTALGIGQSRHETSKQTPSERHAHSESLLVRIDEHVVAFSSHHEALLWHSVLRSVCDHATPFEKTTKTLSDLKKIWTTLLPLLKNAQKSRRSDEKKADHDSSLLMSVQIPLPPIPLPRKFKSVVEDGTDENRTRSIGSIGWSSNCSRSSWHDSAMMALIAEARGADGNAPVNEDVLHNLMDEAEPHVSGGALDPVHRKSQQDALCSTLLAKADKEGWDLQKLIRFMEDERQLNKDLEAENKRLDAIVREQDATSGGPRKSRKKRETMPRRCRYNSIAFEDLKQHVTKIDTGLKNLNRLVSD